MEINHSLMLCARDIETMWRNGVPLNKAIRHMQYLLAAAKRELQRVQDKTRLEYNWYKADTVQKAIKAAR